MLGPPSALAALLHGLETTGEVVAPRDMPCYVIDDEADAAEISLWKTSSVKRCIPQTSSTLCERSSKTVCRPPM
jgi:hypothetical protein